MTLTTNSKSQEAVNTHIVLAWPINGVALNGIEFLLNENGTHREFATKEDARSFIRVEISPDSTDEEQDWYFTFMTASDALAYEDRIASK